MSSEQALQEYLAKRDPAASGEPGAGGEPGEPPRFVIQRHDASTSHHDFRLEVDGVLKSWAVPKGIPADPREKRLAIQTEDHPLEYLCFEGRIPEGQYGAGTVAIWDTGTYENLTEKGGKLMPMTQAIEAGHVKVWLHGKRLDGAYALTRTRLRGRDDQWLLVKVSDAGAGRRRGRPGAAARQG